MLATSCCTKRHTDPGKGIISDHVLNGTVIVTDACYANLTIINNGVYVHHIVIHAYNFVHPVYGDIGTQTTEGLWTQVK